MCGRALPEISVQSLQETDLNEGDVDTFWQAGLWAESFDFSLAAQGTLPLNNSQTSETEEQFTFFKLWSPLCASSKHWQGNKSGMQKN